MQRKGGEGPEVVGNGRWREYGSLGAGLGEQRAGNGAASQTEGQPSPGPKQPPASWVNWQSALYAFVLGLLCVLLVPLTSFWWIVPVLRVAVPLALVVLDKSGSVPKGPDDKRNRERELLGALADRSELTPTTAAMRTSLTVDEAAKMLVELADKGHLKLRTEDGTVAYHLPGHDRFDATDAALETSRARSAAGSRPHPRACANPTRRAPRGCATRRPLRRSWRQVQRVQCSSSFHQQLAGSPHERSGMRESKGG